MVATSADAATAAPIKEITIEIKDHRFTPAKIEVQADEKFVLNVKNLDSAAEEFESHDLKREKVIPAKGEAKINFGPLKAGTYDFVGEFHEDTAKGQIVVIADTSASETAK